jgi:hypothetical protein
MRTASILVMGITAGLTVQAQGGRRPGRGRPAPNAGFTTLDLNGDGVLDASEPAAAPASPAKRDKIFLQKKRISGLLSLAAGAILCYLAYPAWVP